MEGKEEALIKVCVYVCLHVCVHMASGCVGVWVCTLGNGLKNVPKPPKPLSGEKTNCSHSILEPTCICIL